MHRPSNRTASAVVAALMAFAASGALAQSGLSPRLVRSAELIGHYYGDKRVLEDAAVLVSDELRESPNSAAAWTQAAQIAVKGGHIVGPHIKAVAEQQYRVLIDHALEIDPRYAPALSVKADVQFGTHDAQGGCVSARRGIAIDPDFPWLHLEMAHCLDSEDRLAEAIDQIEIVVKGGPNGSLYQREAYPSAMVALARHFDLPENADYLRKLAAETAATLDPHDAWTMGEFADLFNTIEDYEDGIVYARKALAIMDYGVGRSFLMDALQGRAAQLEAAGLDNRDILAQLRAESAASQR